MINEVSHFSPNIISVERAIHDLRSGLPVCIYDDAHAILIQSAETLTEPNFVHAASLAEGTIGIIVPAVFAAHLGVSQSIIDAKPTDGLWGDDRSDEDQIGASYPELEWAMAEVEKNNNSLPNLETSNYTERQKEVLKIYWRMNRANQHKMLPIPVAKIIR